MTNSAKIVYGRAFAQTGAVTMDTNVISSDCTSAEGGTGFSGGALEAVPEPGTFAA